MSQDSEETQAPKPSRGIYLLPNAFTTGALFAGFYGIIASIDGRYTAAAVAIIVAGLLDGLDGRIARMTNTQSEFGVQYDSLSDLISFGLAPAVLVYTWSLSSLALLGNFWGKLGWLAAFLYAACAALRLARFNTQAGVADKRYFQGLATPAAAGLISSLVWATGDAQIEGTSISSLVLGITIVGSLLMVSNVRYISFKQWPVSDKVPFLWILILVLIFVLLAIDPPKVLLAIGATYALSGPALTLKGRRDQRNRRLRDLDGED